MALKDIFRTRTANRLHKHAWAAIWDQVRDAPEEEEGAKLLHVTFVGTLLFATRYQAALAVGMDDTIARGAAMEVVANAGYEGNLRDDVLLGFTRDGNAPGAYPAALLPLVDRVVSEARTCGTVPLGDKVDRAIEAIKDLKPLLGTQLGRQAGGTDFHRETHGAPCT